MIHKGVLSQLATLTLDPNRPLVVVDVDEVIVGLAGHLGEYVETHGYSLQLTSYQLEGALKRRDGAVASEQEFQRLFKGFFETETVRQRAYPDAPEVLDRLSCHAQIVILTNVPPSARDCRIANLNGHGINYPLIVNIGQKGAALAWLADRVMAPIVFIDDSPMQLKSAKEESPQIMRVHFVGDAYLRELLGNIEVADHAPENWIDLEKVVMKLVKSFT